MGQFDITIRHFLNKKVTPRIYRNEKYYPLYIEITSDDKKYNIKSNISEHLKIYQSDIFRICKQDKDYLGVISSGYYSENFFQSILKDQIFPLYQLINDETLVIKKILLYKNSGSEVVKSLKNLQEEYHLNTIEITDLLDIHIKKRYITELKQIFLDSIDVEAKKDLFRISNYMIHFINWNNTFYYYYDLTFEVMPSGLKKIENALSGELQIAIKAFLAYHTNVNVLKRFLEKRELGKISTLSYLDWRTDIKGIVQKQFDKIFGKKISEEYIHALDEILKEAVK
jgi:hypothetical protein